MLGGRHQEHTAEDKPGELAMFNPEQGRSARLAVPVTKHLKDCSDGKEMELFSGVPEESLITKGQEIREMDFG